MKQRRLSKELQFIVQLFQTAIRNTCEVEDTQLILAGGAVRDTYFENRANSVRDLDLYYNTNVIDPETFARALKQLDVDALGRAAGFRSVELERENEPEDASPSFWGEVSVGNARVAINQYVMGINAGQIYYSSQGGATIAAPVAQPVPAVPQPTQAPQPAQVQQYQWHQPAGMQIQAAPAHGQGSASGSKIDKTGKIHPLRGIEEFTCYIDGREYYVELMSVAMNPVDYVMKEFAVKLSRCYYDGNKLTYTPDFFTDARNKTLTVACRVENARFERLFSYYLPKMRSYFPDFEVRVDLDQMNRPSW